MRISILFASLFFTIFFSNSAFSFYTPSISANALFLYQNSNFHKEDANPLKLDEKPNGFDVQETELQFYSDVDPYTRLSLLFSVAPHYVTDGVKISHEWGIEPEEAFAESNVISDVTLKIGKFKAAMGKHNTLHPHAYPFIGAPLANDKLLGDEGFKDAGVSAAVLVPTSWFNEITLQYLKGKGDNSEFNSPAAAQGVGLVHWKNLFDLTDSTTFEIGGSFAQGGNSFRQTTALSGADLTLKWRPSEGGKYTSFLLAAEYLSRKQSQAGLTDEIGNGLASWIQYQFAQRWTVSYRYDDLGIKNTFDPNLLPNGTITRNSLGLIFAPSEFSAYKFEYNQTHGTRLNADQDDTEKSIFLQANFTIGAHPTHSY